MSKNTLKEVIDAIDFISSDIEKTSEAYICITTGEVITYWPEADDPSALPTDVLDETLYLPIPHKQDFRLGAPLAIEFAEARCPEHLEEVRSYFRKQGAYREFKALLDSVNLLDAWYQYEQEATVAAVKNWLQASGIAIAT